jgi:hypothetical protein
LPSEALGLFISDTVSGLDRNGRDSVTTLLRRVIEIVPYWLDRRPRLPPEVGQHPAAVLDRDLELVALRETRSSSQPPGLAANFPFAPKFEDGTALVGFQDSLRFAR